MTIKTAKDVEGLQRIGNVVSLVLRKMLAAIEPGMTTAELDQIGQALLAQWGARSAPQLTYGFPGATCISVNEEAAHGVPSARQIQPGDVVNVDVSAELNGYFADTGASRIVPPTSPDKEKLLSAAQLALRKAVKVARAGAPINHIGKAIQRVATAHRYQIIRNLGGHGIGRALHEAPEHIPGFYTSADRRLLKEGMVITIEPFLSTGSQYAREGHDGWTLSCARGNLTAQFEHTLIVTRGKPIVVTTL